MGLAVSLNTIVYIMFQSHFLINSTIILCNNLCTFFDKDDVVSTTWGRESTWAMLNLH